MIGRKLWGGMTDDSQEELTEFERALLAAIHVSSPRVKRAMAPYLLSLAKCWHGNRTSECRRCLFSVSVT